MGTKKQKIRLTAAIIKDAKPGKSPYRLYDTVVTGFAIRVQPSGYKSFVCEYLRTTATIGDASQIKLPAARNRAREILTAAVVDGVDHNAEQRKVDEAKRVAAASELGVYLKDHWLPYAENHIVSYADIQRRLQRNFGHLYDTPMSDITELDIERWRRKKAGAKRPVTYETLRLELTYLKAVLNLAVTEFKLLPYSPLQGCRLKRLTNKPERSNDDKLRYLERGVEDVRLRKALTARDDKMRLERESANRWRSERGKDALPSIGAYGDHLTPIVLLSLNTGWDRGDLFDLTVEQIDFPLNHIRKSRNKTSHRGKPKVWVQPLSTEARTILKTWMKETGITTGRVFPSPVTGERLTDIKHGWNTVVADAKLENFRFKDLRHTFASWLVSDGVPLNTVRELMCHQDIKTTLIYAHLSPDHKADAVAAVFDR